MTIILLGNSLTIFLVILSLMLRLRGDRDDRPEPIDFVRGLYRRHSLQGSNPNWLQKLLRIRTPQ